MPCRIGTSGWQYRDWKGRFYPDGVAQARWLEHYADQFDCVEVNNTFYRLPQRSTFEDWAARTPDDFVWVCKMSRFFSHVKRLKDPREPVERFFGAAAGLGAKLGPVLIQLPPNMRRDDGRLRDALDVFPRGAQVVLEFRHDSWFDDDVFSILAGHDAALCLTDRASRVTGPVERTASFGYLRMHQGTASPKPCYGRAALAHWAERMAHLWPPGSDTYVFFNNDAKACAVRDAARFSHYAGRAGLAPTRTPATRDVYAGSGSRASGTSGSDPRARPDREGLR